METILKLYTIHNKVAGIAGRVTLQMKLKARHNPKQENLHYRNILLRNKYFIKMDYVLNQHHYSQRGLYNYTR